MITGEENKGTLVTEKVSTVIQLLWAQFSGSARYMCPSLPLRVWRLLTSVNSIPAPLLGRAATISSLSWNMILVSSFWHYIALGAISCVSYHCGRNPIIRSHYKRTLSNTSDTSFCFLCYALNPDFPSSKACPSLTISNWPCSLTASFHDSIPQQCIICP